jgi:hypothetical protein
MDRALRLESRTSHRGQPLAEPAQPAHRPLFRPRQPPPAQRQFQLLVDRTLIVPQGLEEFSDCFHWIDYGGRSGTLSVLCLKKMRPGQKPFDLVSQQQEPAAHRDRRWLACCDCTSC